MTTVNNLFARDEDKMKITEWRKNKFCEKAQSHDTADFDKTSFGTMRRWICPFCGSLFQVLC